MDQTNNNQPNQTPPTEGSTPTPVTPAAPATAPTPEAPAAHAATAGIPTATPNVAPPTQPKKSPMPVILGAVIILLLAMAAAYYFFFMKPKSPTAQTPVAHVQTQPATAAASQTRKEIEAVDSNASDSSDLQSVQNDINKL